MLDEYKVFIGVLMLDFHIPESQSLKAKRSVLKSFKDKVRSKFNASVSELAELDKWQRSIFGVSMISNDQGYIQECLQSILNYAHSLVGAHVLASRIEFY